MLCWTSNRKPDSSASFVCALAKRAASWILAASTTSSGAKRGESLCVETNSAGYENENRLFLCGE